MLCRKSWIFLFLLCITAIGVFYRSSWIVSVYQDSFPPQNSSICTCHKCLMDYDPWFTELMNASPEPFMSLKTQTSADTFKWWGRLGRERSSFNYYNKTVKDVFQMFPFSPNYTKSRPDHCRTCAVVGNSGNLNGSRYGSLIDFHDIVIRINRGPIEGFEKDVGTKTTHRTMFPRSAMDLDNTTHLVLVPFLTKDLRWLIKTFGPRKTTTDSELKANKDLVRILNPSFMKYVHFVWLKRKGKYPSTGFLTLILSMHLCDEISVFGFGANRQGYWDHYFEKVRKPRRGLNTGVHPGSHEYKIINELYKRKKIIFFKGW